MLHPPDIQERGIYSVISVFSERNNCLLFLLIVISRFSYDIAVCISRHRGPSL